MFTPSPASPGCRTPSWACRPPRCRGRRCRGRARAGGWPAWSPPRRCSPGSWVNIFTIKIKYFSATHPAHNLRVLEDLLLDHGEAALHEGSVSSSVPRHAFILNLKNRIRSEKMVYYMCSAPYVQCTLELKDLSFFLIFIILQALFNAPMCVDSENLCMGSPALLKKVRTPSKKWAICS